MYQLEALNICWRQILFRCAVPELNFVAILENITHLKLIYAVYPVVNVTAK